MAASESRVRAIAHSRPTIFASLATAGMTLSAGCAPAPSDDLVPVSGRVLLNGKPLESGSVSLRPESRETWHQPTGSIEAEGRYTLYTVRRPGAPPGQYRVVVFATTPGKTPGGAAHPGLPQSLIPKRYNDPQSTPLRIVVPPRPKSGPPVSPPSFDLEIVSDAS